MAERAIGKQTQYYVGFEETGKYRVKKSPKENTQFMFTLGVDQNF